MAALAQLLNKITAAAHDNDLSKITFGRKRNTGSDLKNVFVRPVLLKDIPMLSFVYRHATKDITKNFSVEEGLAVVTNLLRDEFFNADVFTSLNTIYFSVDDAGKEKLVIKNQPRASIALTHDKQKQRLIDTHSIYLRELGVTGEAGLVKKEMQHKFRQINRYVEIIDGIIKDEKPGAHLNIVDTGSGKGYLTFALYEHLLNKKIDAAITGIELRKDLVAKCNGVALKAGYQYLHFVEGSIAEIPATNIDMLIALHACDTATDDAIAKGIKANAKYIICAPCCHKQIRKEMSPANALQQITRHGILLERQAEMVTDTIRALLLAAHGYSTKVIEFIDEEDTPKNVMIVGVKTTFDEKKKQENEEQVNELKKLFGIKTHYLETLLHN